MFNPIEGGSVINIQGLNCNLPPAGYVYNIVTKKLDYVGVYRRAEKDEDCYWEKIPTPDWYKDVMKKWDSYDKTKKEDDDDFYDERLEKFKAQEWHRRLNGFWFRNNDKDCYLTGLHYYYLQYWQIDIGSPKFRMPDLEKAYFIDYCFKDPLCMGMVEVTKRRFGKSFWAGAFLTEYITRTKMTNGGIQSKTGNDAKKFFGKTVVNPFRRLPKFFRPIYDTSLGSTPKSELRFQKPNVRGKKSDENIADEELGSLIDWASADAVAYDGNKLQIYIADEVGKCFGKGTKIRMFDGSIKNVEDIENGEYVMGDDSTKRLVYGKTRGVEKMYKITSKKGRVIVCNKSHILTLSVSDRILINGVKYLCGDIVNISIEDYFKINPVYRKCLALYKVGWEYEERNHIIDPYMFGIWLGDGKSTDFSITTTDFEVLDSIKYFAFQHGLFVRQKKDKISYHVTSKKVGVNHITKELRRLSVLKNKHIPLEYLIDSRENRLKLLAGLVDSDGHVSKRGNYHSNIVIVQKKEILSDGILELANSLGFYAKKTQRKARMKRKDGSIYECVVYNVAIYGDIDLIPCRVERKKPVVSRTKNRRNPCKSGFKIEEIGLGEYYGFAVDRNHLFLLEDGTVVHNTTEVNVYDRHEVVRYCMLDDEGKIIGKALYTTTVEKLDSDKDGVQAAFKLLWDESNQLKKGEDGRTPSGLYRFFMSAKKTRNFDAYGYADEEKTIKAILADRETVKNNPRALSARIRKEPLTIEEAFMTDSDKCIFNTVNIGNRKRYLAENPPFMRKVLFYRNTDGIAGWREVPNPESDNFHWKILQFPPTGQENKSKRLLGLKCPDRISDGAMTVDGYSNSQGGQKYGSRASAWIGRRYDILDPHNTGKAIGWLYGRPNIKEMLHEQVLLAAEYYGYEVAYEHNSDDYLSYFRERGMINYLAKYPLSTIDPNKRQEAVRYRGFPTTPFSLTKQVDVGISYFEHHIDLIDYIELLEDAEQFDPEARTVFDITVSFLMLLVMLQEPVNISKKKEEPIVKIYPTPITA